MLRMAKNDASKTAQKYTLCAFEIYYRNPAFDVKPDDLHLDPENRQIHVVPSIFHQGNDEMHSYNFIGMNLKSIQKVLMDSGFPLSADNRFFYRCLDDDDAVEMKTDSDVYDALIAAKDSRPQAAVLIVEGDFVMTKNGLENLSIAESAIETSDTDATKINSKDVDVKEWFQSCMDNCRDEIIKDLTIKMASGVFNITPTGEDLSNPEFIPNDVELNYIRRMRLSFGRNWVSDKERFNGNTCMYSKRHA